MSRNKQKKKNGGSGLFKFRKVPNGEWYDSFNSDKYLGVVYGSKGLTPIYTPKSETLIITPIPDLMDIAAIDFYLKKDGILKR
jgi:hypothetical protein